MTGIWATFASIMRSTRPWRYSSGIGDGHLPAVHDEFPKRGLAMLSGTTPGQHCRRIDDTEHMPLRIDNGEARVLGAGVGQESGDLVQRHRLRQRLDVRRHDLLHPRQRERIDLVFARQMMAASGDLLGQDGTAHQQHGERPARSRTRRSAAVARACCRSAPPRRTSRSAASASCRPSSRTSRAAARTRGSPPAESRASAAPMPPPMISSGASTPPEVPEPSATDQMIAFTTSSRIAAAGSMFALQHLRDVVVADAERPGIDQAADPDHQAAQRRPPHPMDRQLLEPVLAGVHKQRQHAGQKAGQIPTNAQQPSPSSENVHAAGRTETAAKEARARSARPRR